jgi:hypothetical protein
MNFINDAIFIFYFRFTFRISGKKDEFIKFFFNYSKFNLSLIFNILVFWLKRGNFIVLDSTT